MTSKMFPFKILLKEGETYILSKNRKVYDGPIIPQHQLISQKTWNYIKSGKINHWTYYAITGNDKHQRHHHSITIYPEDY